MIRPKKQLFRGVATALITPFADGKIDKDAFCSLIERQINGGIAAILVAGTTGEASTLSFEEHAELVALAKRQIAGRVPLLAGCSSNCTSRAAELAKNADLAGADGLLAVTPYYNKTSDRGIVLHYQAIADASQKPLIVYNVPSRTGFFMTPEQCVEIAKIPTVVGVKEASGNLSLTDTILRTCPELSVYTGNDDQTVAAMRLGAAGVISVCSNLYPREMSEICNLCDQGNFDDAEKKIRPMLPQISALFREVNPIPVKEVAAMWGLCRAEYRLPLCQASDDTKRILKKFFDKEQN